MNDQTPNPYEAPKYAVPLEPVEAELAPPNCPSCGTTDVFATPHSSWYGRRGPRAIEDMTCRKCECNFHGETGVEYPPRKNPIFWFLLSLILFLLYIFANFALALTGP